jgi:hypothetical protein
MTEAFPDPQDPQLLRQKLALETARIDWRALEVHHARGVVVQVSEQLDLVDVAMQLISDNKSQFEAWLASGAIGPVADADAHAWHHNQTAVWALVVAPWVLVQQRGGNEVAGKPASARLQ